jgi:hypothetical protein
VRAGISRNTGKTLHCVIAVMLFEFNAEIFTAGEGGSYGIRRQAVTGTPQTNNGPHCFLGKCR